MGRSRTQTQSSPETSQFIDNNEETTDQTEIIDPEVITFTRCLLLNRSITEEEMNAMYTQIFTDDPQLQDFRTVLKDINESLRESKIKIVTQKCDVTNQQYYLVVPTYFKPTQIWPSLNFKETDLNFIKTVISEIIISDVGLVTRERVIRKHKIINNDDANNILEKLVEDNYLIEPRDGKYTLSALSMGELEPYFHYTYKDTLKKCIFCKRIMFFGGICQNCKKCGHFSCMANFKESMKNKATNCPSCNTEWSQNVSENMEDILDYYGDEDAVIEEEEDD